jgi:hypothetical protein
MAPLSTEEQAAQAARRERAENLWARAQADADPVAVLEYGLVNEHIMAVQAARNALKKARN